VAGKTLLEEAAPTPNLVIPTEAGAPATAQWRNLLFASAA